MSPNRPDLSNLDTLIEKYLEGISSPVELDKLASLLRDHAQARETFIEAVQLDTLLFDHFDRGRQCIKELMGSAKEAGQDQRMVCACKSCLGRSNAA